MKPLKGERQSAGPDNIFLGRLGNAAASVIQRFGCLSVGIGYGLVRGHDRVKPNMLDFRSELGTNVGLVLPDGTFSDVDDPASRVMHRSKRSDRQLLVIACQQAPNWEPRGSCCMRKPGPFVT
jgi:hypothetical protein